jgi:hypothetical protein
MPEFIQKSRVPFFVACALSLLPLSLCDQASGQFSGPPPGGPGFSTLALSGAQAGGEPSGVTYNGFGIPGFDVSGRAAFEAGLTGPGITAGGNDGAIFSGYPGEPALPAVQKGSTAPGTSSATFSFLANPALNSAGQVAFEAGITGGDVSGTTNNSGVWAGAPGAINLIFRKAGGAPSTAGAAFSSFGNPVISASGLVAVEANFTGGDVNGTTNNGAIYTATPSAATLLARKGSQIPGLTSNDSFGFLGNPVITPGSAVAFEGAITGGDVNGTTNNAAIFVGYPSQPIMIAVRKGSTAAPGTTAIGGGPGVFSFLGNPAMNNAGQIAFEASVTGGNAIAGVNDSGIWEGAPSALQLVSRKGDAAPGTTISNAASNAQGSSDTFKNYQDPALDPNGVVAFIASLNGSDVVTGTGGNDIGLWLGTPGNLDLIARKGFGFDVNPLNPGADIRTVAGIDLVYTSSNVVAFHLSFTDGSSGEFTANLPEPATFAILGMASGLLLLRPRRRIAKL